MNQNKQSGFVKWLLITISVLFLLPVKSKTKRSLRNILRNYIKNTNRTEIKKSGYFVGNGRGNGKKYFYENRFPFRCI